MLLNIINIPSIQKPIVSNFSYKDWLDVSIDQVISNTAAKVIVAFIRIVLLCRV